MELDISYLKKSPDPRALDFIAFLEGALHLGLIDSQYKMNGRVIPWNSLVRLNHVQLPEWDGDRVAGFMKFSGEFLSSVDKEFDKELHQLLHIPRRNAIVFDMDYMRDAYDTDTIAFMCESGIVHWYTTQNPNINNKWFLSVYSNSCICCYQMNDEEVCKYIVISEDSEQRKGSFSQQDLLNVLDMFITHIKWCGLQEWEFKFDEFELSADNLAYLEKYLKDLYDIQYSWGVLKFVPKE